LTDAEKHFKSGQNSESHSTVAGMGLGKIALRNKNWDQAIGFFYQASQQATGTVSPATLLAIALRHAGKVDKTRTELQRVLARDPLNHPALYEMASGIILIARRFSGSCSESYRMIISTLLIWLAIT